MVLFVLFVRKVQAHTGYTVKYRNYASLLHTAQGDIKDHQVPMEDKDINKSFSAHCEKEASEPAQMTMKT